MRVSINKKELSRAEYFYDQKELKLAVDRDFRNRTWAGHVARRAAKFVRINTAAMAMAAAAARKRRRKGYDQVGHTLIQPRSAGTLSLRSLGGQTLIISGPASWLSIFPETPGCTQTGPRHTPSDMMQQVNRFPSQNLHTAGGSVAHRLVDISSTWRAPIQHRGSSCTCRRTHVRDTCKLADVYRI